MMKQNRLYLFSTHSDFKVRRNHAIISHVSLEFNRHFGHALKLLMTNTLPVIGRGA